MKTTILTLTFLVSLVGCGSTDNHNGPQASQVSEVETIGGGEKPVDNKKSIEEFSHLLNTNDVCSKDFEPVILKDSNGPIDLGTNSNGYAVTAEFELYLFEDGGFIAKYVETEDREETYYDSNGNLISKPQRKKIIHGNWTISGKNILLPEIGIGYSLGKDKRSMELTFGEALISKYLVGQTVILNSLENTTLKKKVLCPEVYALGPFEDYRYYQWPSVMGLEKKNIIINSSDSDKTWSFKVFIDENNSFDVQYFVVPEKNHIVWGWENGKWTRSGNILSLGDLATLEINDDEVSIKFNRRMNVEDALPKDMRDEFDQTGKEYSLTLTDGYL